MKHAITIATASVAAVLMTLTLSVSAQDFNTQKRTFLTFSAPVEMPGVTLEAGTYVFKIADTPGRNVVQVFDKDEKDIIGQWLFVQAQRPQVADETVVTFKENLEGTTPAVQFWYYPGERTGREFIYPKDQAMRIAARTGVGVRTEDGIVEGSGMPSASAEQPAAGATVAASATVPHAEAAAAATETQATQTTQYGTPRTGSAVGTSGRYDPPMASATSGSDDQAATMPERNVRQESTTAYNEAELPRTSSPLALSGLLGFLALAGAAGLRRYRQQ